MIGADVDEWPLLGSAVIKTVARLAKRSGEHGARGRVELPDTLARIRMIAPSRWFVKPQPPSVGTTAVSGCRVDVPLTVGRSVAASNR